MRSKARMWRCSALLALLGGVLTLAPGCAEDTTTVTAGMREFEIALSQPTAIEGWVEFVISNVGEEEHEFMLIATDLAEDALPTNPDGSYLENGPGTEVVLETEHIAPGTTVDVTHHLDAARYVVICNIVETEPDGEVESHYAMGMHTSFTVIKG